MSFLMAFITLFGINKYSVKRRGLSSLNQESFHSVTRIEYKLNDPYEVYKQQHVSNFIHNLPPTKSTCDSSNILMYNWLKLVTIPSYLLLVLGAMILVVICSCVSTASTKYLYITYFKDRNHTITIQVFTLFDILAISNLISTTLLRINRQITL